MDHNLLGDKIINTMETVLSDFEKKMQQLFAIEFERCWQILKKDKDKCTKVKKNFVHETVFDIYINCRDTFDKCKLDIPSIEEIVNYVFHYHYFYTCEYTDSERANLQKKTDYKDKLKNEIIQTFIKKGYTAQNKIIATPYNPEVNTCIFLCDQVLRVLQSLPQKEDMGAPEKQRYDLLKKLFFKFFSFARNIIFQLTYSIPSEAIISWRALFELEYTIRVLERYDHVLTHQYQMFGEFSLLDKDGKPKYQKKYKEIAKLYNRNPNDIGFKNYGWLLCIDNNESTLTLHSLLKICNDEERYKTYQNASGFVHSNSSIFYYPQQEIYLFLMRQIYISLNHVIKTMEHYVSHYQVSIDENEKKRLSESWYDYVEKLEQNILTKIQK